MKHKNKKIHKLMTVWCCTAVSYPPGRYTPNVLIPGWVLQYLGMVGRLLGDYPRLGGFQSDWVPIVYLNRIRLTPSFYRKIGLSLPYLVPGILGPKFGLIFHQNVLFNRF